MLFLLVILAECSGKKSAFDMFDAPHHEAELKQIGELMKDNPASAFDSVRKYENEVKQWSFADRNEWRLRFVESAYKSRQPMDDCPDLDKVTLFYDSLSLLFPDDEALLDLQARAYYYKGVVSSMQNDDLEATRSFLKVLTLMQTDESTLEDSDNER